MRIVRHPAYCPPEARHSVVALGNFDGVHRGHKAVIETAVTLAKQHNTPAAVMTFEPHPRTILQPDCPPLRLTPFRDKMERIAACGINVTFCLHFNHALSQLSGEDFVQHILYQQLKVAHIVTGHDFIFGHQRSGNVALLKQLADQYGYKVTQLDDITQEDNIRYSSTAIREALQRGDIATAQHILGHDYTLSGRVIYGKQLGRTIGFPTANIALKNHLRPAFGVYTAHIRIDGDDNIHNAIINIGRKPTVGGTQELIEVHLLDITGELYGKRLYVTPLTYIRAERRFETIDALKTQISLDCHQARLFFEEDYKEESASNV